MKILLLIDNFGSGGAQRQIITLASLFKNRGDDVEFLTYDSGDFFLPVVKNLGIRVHHVDNKSSLERIVKVRKQINKVRYDVVVSFMDTPNFLNCISSVFGYKRVVVTSERSCDRSIFHGIKHKIYNWFQRYSDAIVCNSENAVTMWRKYFPRYSPKLHCIYNAVLLPSISSNYKIRSGGKTHIVVAASCQFLKNSINVAKAMAKLSDDIRQKIIIDWYGAQNVVAGGKSCYDRTISIIQSNGLEKSMIMHTPSSNIANIMNEADCIAIFSKYEGLPNAICEGMMIGKPVIMSRVSDYNRFVDNTNGFLCDWDNVDSIADALKNIAIVKDEELISMGNSSFEKAHLLFDPEVVAENWESLIKSLI